MKFLDFFDHLATEKSCFLFYWFGLILVIFLRWFFSEWMLLIRTQIYVCLLAWIGHYDSWFAFYFFFFLDSSWFLWLTRRKALRKFDSLPLFRALIDCGELWRIVRNFFNFWLYLSGHHCFRKCLSHSILPLKVILFIFILE